MAEAKRISNEMGAEVETSQMKMAALGVEFKDMTADLGNALTPALKSITEKLLLAGKAAADFMRRGAEDDTETSIRNLKEMGANTTSLELAYTKLQKRDALKDLKEDASDLANNTEKLVLAEGRLDLIQQTKNENAQRMVELQTILTDNMEIQRRIEAEPTAFLKEYHGDGPQILIDQLRLVGKAELELKEIEEMDEGMTNRINNLDLEIEKREELERLKLQEIALEQQLNGVKEEVVEKDPEVKKVKELSKLRLGLNKQKEDSEKRIKKMVVEGAAFQKAHALRGAVENAYAMAQKAYQSMAGIPVVGQVLGAAAAAAAFGLGMSYHAKIASAQYGADFVTSGPQMMMVGEGRGPEHVQVTPLVDDNINGPQGGGITLNISGNVMSEEYTEDVIIPQIKEGLRLGGDIGLN